MGVDHAKPGPLADGPDPTVGRATIQTMTILATEDRSFRSLPDDQIESPGCPRHERDERRLMSLAHDPEGPVPTVDGEVFDVRPTGLAHSEAVESEQHGECGMVRVESLCGV